ncbi:hypothetical protein [Flavobacterium phage FL-1]|nr:hypothetical protein [Flavobacterium phage FL-1]
MKKKELELRVLEIVEDQYSVIDEKIDLESNFHELGNDSLDKVEFVMDLEKEFDIEIEDERLDELNVIQNYVDIVAEKLNIME